MEREYVGPQISQAEAFARAQSNAIGGAAGAPEKRESHFEGLNNKLGNVQDLAANLEEGLRVMADRLLGELPSPPETAKQLREVGFPCSGVVGELFERASNLDDRLRCALRELDRLKRLA